MNGKILHNIFETGICFGGNFYAHGVMLAQGSATFRVLEYSFITSN